MAGCLCDQCAALCCRYFALPIENPRTRRQYDDVRWYLLHENVVIFIQKKQWYLGVMTRCKQLQADNRCGIYETRPNICRSYSTRNCDYHGDEYDHDELFTSGEQLMKYAREQLRKQRRKPKAKTAPPKRPRAVLRRARLRLVAPAAEVRVPLTVLGSPTGLTNG